MSVVRSWRMDRARRSSRATTSTSPSRANSKAAASCGRSARVPLIDSSKHRSHPAALRASNLTISGFADRSRRECRPTSPPVQPSRPAASCEGAAGSLRAARDSWSRPSAVRQAMIVGQVSQRSRSSKAEPNSSTNCGSVVVPVTIERGEAVFAKAGNQRCSPLTLRCRTVQHFTANEVRSTYYRFARDNWHTHSEALNEYSLCGSKGVRPKKS